MSTSKLIVANWKMNGGLTANETLLRALRETGYRGFCAVEPFDYHPDGPTAAARAIGYLQGVMESL